MSTAEASFYVTGGTLRQDAPSYVERKADRDLYEGLIAEEFCYVLTSRQMGKSSLMVHTAARLREAGVQVAVLDLTAIGQNLSAEQWYGGLLRRLGLQLDASGKLEEALDEFWFDQQARMGPLERWMQALQQVVLPAVGVGCQVLGVRESDPGGPSVPNTQHPTPNTPRLVIFIDEIDAVRGLPFSTDEFFAAIRECYNRRGQDPDFARLTFCLLGVASPSDLIRDTRMTPFNIGRRIELTDFTAAEAGPLAAGLSPTAPPAPPLQGEGGRAPATASPDQQPTMAPPSLAGKGVGGLGPAAALLQRILFWTGGHPYLTQRLCQTVARDPSVTEAAGVDRLCEALFLSASAQEQDDNLLFVRERLLKSEADLASLLDLYGQVRAGRRVALDDTNQLVSLLRLSGITRVVDGRLQVRNQIYERVFDRAWVRQHMPDAELRRQRAAYRRGLWRAAGVSAAILAVVGSLAVAAVREAHRANRIARAEAAQRRLAQEGQRALRRSQYANGVSLAQQAEEANNLARAQELLDLTRPAPGEEDLRGFEWRYLWRRCQGNALATLRGYRSWVCAVAFSPDGKLLATGSMDRTLRVWDLAGYPRNGGGQVIAKFDTSRPDYWVAGLAFSPDGKTLVWGADGRVRRWDVASRRQIAALPGDHGAGPEVAFSPDGRLLASGNWDGTVRLWAAVPGATGRRDGKGGQRQAAGTRQPAAWQTIATIQGCAETLHYQHSLTFSPDSRLLVTSSRNGPVRLWDVAGYGRAPGTAPKSGPRLVATFGSRRETAWCAAFSPDGKTLATGSSDHRIRLWDLATKRAVATLSGHTDEIFCVAFSPDGKTLASSSFDSTIKLWDPATRQALTTLKGHKGGVIDITFSRDGRLLASGSYDGTVKLWTGGAGGAGYPPKVGEGPGPGAARAATTDVIRQKAGFDAVAFSPNGRTLVTGSEDGAVKLWNPDTRREIGALRGHKKPVASLAFSADGKLLATGSDDHTVKLWNLAGRRAIGSLPGFKGSDGAISLSPDGRALAFQGEKAIKVWDLAAKRVVASIPWEKGVPWNSAGWGMLFSPDGRTLAAITGPGVTTLWDVPTRRATGTLLTMGTFVFSSDGKMLAELDGSDVVSRQAMKAQLWDPASRRRLATLRWPATSWTDAIALSPDQRTLAVGNRETVVLLNLATRQETVVLKGHTSPVTWLAFSPDGNTLASASLDGTVRLWRAATFQETDPLQVVASGSDRSVTLQWQPLPAAVAYRLYRGPAGAGPTRPDTQRSWVRLATLPAAAASFTDRSPFLVNGRPQTYAAAAVFPAAGGQTVEGPRVSLQSIPVAVPPGWLGTSISEGVRSGLALFEDPTGPIRVRGSGADISGPADGCYFLNRPATGDFQITVRALTRPSGTRAGARAGLMLRESLAPGARMVCLTVPAVGSLEWRWRQEPNSPTEDRPALAREAMRLPLLLRLTRRGSTVAAAYSADEGQTFLAGEPVTFDPPLPPTVEAGLAITADDEAQISQARFQDLKIGAVNEHADSFQEADLLRMVSITSGDRSVTLQWQPLSSAVGYHLYRGPAGAGRSQMVELTALPAAAGSFTDRSSVLVSGRPQTYAAAAVFPTTRGKTVEGPWASVQATPGAAPSGWLGASISEGAHSGSARFVGPAGPILIRGSGVDIWDTADQCYYLCQPVHGNFQITVRALTRPTATDPWAKAGLMLRESPAAGARDASLITSAANGLHFQWRGTANSLCEEAQTVLQDQQLKLPILLRLTRRGDTVTASYSRDGGRHFLPAGHPLRFDEPLPATLYAGLAITAHDPDRVSEARFDDLRVELSRG